MIIILGNKTYQISKRKESESFLIYSVSGNSYKKIFEGPKNEMHKTVKHLKHLANKRETRAMIADMCGTSYRAACEDMGLSKI